MFEILWIILIYVRSLLRSQHELALEALTLRHQIMVLKRRRPRPNLRPWDRLLWTILKRTWPNWEAPHGAPWLLSLAQGANPDVAKAHRVIVVLQLDKDFGSVRGRIFRERFPRHQGIDAVGHAR